MLESPAWRVLSLSARRVIERIEIELAHHGGNDNGKLPVTYDQFVDYGIERHAIAPAIREAEALGLVRVTERGVAGNREYRSPNKFMLTYHPAQGVTMEHGKGEWQHIDTMEAASNIQRMARGARPDRPYRPAKQKQKSSVGKPTGFSAENPH